MLHALIKTPPTLGQYAAAANSSAIRFTIEEGWALQGTFTVNTPSAKTFVAGNVNTGTSQVTVTGHGYSTGLLVTLTTTGSLPTGLNTATNYWIIVIDANTIQFASSLANAQAGTFITISAVGSGTQTITATTLAGATAKIQVSIDGITWSDLASSSQNITVTSTFYWSDNRCYYNYIRIATAITSGQILPTLLFCTKF